MRFVTPDVDRIDLKDGPNGEKNWIEVKKDLTAGEDKSYRTAGFRRISAPGAVAGKDKKFPQEDETPQIDVDWKRLSFARAEAYITNWSDKKPLSRSAIEALVPEDFEEIDKAIEAHIEARDAEKKATIGSGTLTPSLP